MAKTYNFFSINVESIFKHCLIDTGTNGEHDLMFQCDFSKGTDTFEGLVLFDSKSKIIRQKNCMLFDQIRYCKEEKNKTENESDKDNKNENEFLRDLIYLDFSSLGGIDPKKVENINCKEEDRISLREVHQNNIPQNLFILFKKGLQIKYKGNDGDTIVKYYPFDRSASMVRNKRMTFVQSGIFEELEKRTMLDWNFNKPLRDEESTMNIVLDKFFAYRGLNLSDATRIECVKDYLNKNNIIVIKDDNTKSEKVKIITNTKPGNDERFKCEINESRISIESIFDGEGLITPELAGEISNELFENDNGSPATSFQIRMPFAKGMLHSVDFHDFFRKYLDTETAYEDIEIEDYFGKKRKLSDAKIILTDGQFKCAKWLKNYYRDNDDPMEEYFKRLNDYKYSLYIVRTDKSITSSNDTNNNDAEYEPASFSYQYLNTLNLNDKKFNEIINKGLKKYLIFDGEQTRDEKIKAYTDFINNTNYMWKKAAIKNPFLIYDNTIQDDYRSYKRSQLVKIEEGKIPIDSVTLFLSRDLLSLLIYIGKKAVGETDNIKNLYKAQLLSNEFYAPATEKNVKDKMYYSLYRSPHLSRNETCALKPFKANKSTAYLYNKQLNNYEEPKPRLYSRYFKNLKGVLMIPRNSYVAETLGGADFDGDTVLLVLENAINEAVLDGAYNKKTYKRKKEIISITPALSSKNNEKFFYRTYSDKDDYPEYIKDNFLKKFIDSMDNSIGRISNSAISIGRFEYSEDAFSKIKQNPNFSKAEQNTIEKILEDTKYNPTAFAGILAGLEIDAAKTGVHPTRNIDDIKMLADCCNKANAYSMTEKLFEDLEKKFNPFQSIEEAVDFAKDNELFEILYNPESTGAFDSLIKKFTTQKKVKSIKTLNMLISFVNTCIMMNSAAEIIAESESHSSLIGNKSKKQIEEIAETVKEQIIGDYSHIISNNLDYYINLQNLFFKKSGGVSYRDYKIEEGRIWNRKAHYSLIAINKQNLNSNVDKLPYIFTENFSKANKGFIREAKRQPVFIFEEEPEYLSLDEGTIREVEQLALAFKKHNFAAKPKSVQHTKFKLRFEDDIEHIIMCKYGGYYAYLGNPEKGVTIESFLRDLKQELNEKSVDDISEMIERLVNIKWQFLGEDGIDRLEEAKKILDISEFNVIDEDAFKDFMCDFRLSGHKLLFYYLQNTLEEKKLLEKESKIINIEACLKEQDDDIDIDEEQNDSKGQNNNINIEAFTNFCSAYNDYYKNQDERKAKSLRDVEADSFKVELRKIFGKECCNGKTNNEATKKALMYSYYVYKKKQTGSFFWRVFNEKETIEYICERKVEDLFAE